MVVNYFQILGVRITSTDGEIKDAFRKKALLYHPDKNPGISPEKMKEINRAYAVLLDPVQKALHVDELVNPTPTQEFSGQKFYGAPPRPRPPHPPPPKKSPNAFLEVGVSLEEVYQGLTKNYNVYRQVWMWGELRMVIKRITVILPRSLREGQEIIFKNLGYELENCLPGDLHIRFNTKPHPIYSRKGCDLTMKMTISLKEGLLGVMDVPTVSGSLHRIDMRPETIAHGDFFEIDNAGMKTPGVNRFGKLFVEVEVDTPRKLSVWQRIGVKLLGLPE